jgi:mono/diheme cytochrome c family protein
MIASRAVVATLALALAACGSPPPRREWTPDDHGQPQRSAGERSADGAEPPADDGTDPMVRAAQALWNVSCASCHGRGGRGDGASRPPGATMPDMATSAWQDARTDDAVATAIRDGRGMMPEFGTKMHDEAIRALVTHVRTLREAP